MSIIVYAAIILLTISACAAFAAGSMLLAELLWRRSAAEQTVRKAEAFLRAHAAKGGPRSAW